MAEIDVYIPRGQEGLTTDEDIRAAVRLLTQSFPEFFHIVDNDDPFIYGDRQTDGLLVELVTIDDTRETSNAAAAAAFRFFSSKGWDILKIEQDWVKDNTPEEGEGLVVTQKPRRKKKKR